MANFETVKNLIEKQGSTFAEFKASMESRQDAIEATVDRMLNKAAAVQMGIGGGHGVVNTNAAVAGLGQYAKTGLPQASMSVGSESDGGTTVRPELDTLIRELQRDFSPIRQLAGHATTDSKQFDVVYNVGGTASGWVAETAARTETTTPKLATIEIPLFEVYANPAATQQLIDDAPFDVGSFLTREIAREFVEQEGDAFLNGDGEDRPHGILDYATAATTDATRPFGTLQHVETGTASEIGPDDLVSLYYALKAGYRSNAAWLMNSATARAVSLLKDGVDRPLWNHSLATSEPATLLGRPVFIDENMPGAADGATPVLFGDFGRGYLIVDRTAMRVLRDPYSNKPYVMFYSTKRVGGAVTDSNAIKVLKVAAEGGDN